MAFKERVFSGVQPTGNLHLGNYLCALVKFVALQERYDCIYCVVDLHAITTWQDPVELPRAIREVTAAFIAAGIDPKTHIVFNQRQVAEHADPKRFHEDDPALPVRGGPHRPKSVRSSSFRPWWPAGLDCEARRMQAPLLNGVYLGSTAAELRANSASTGPCL